MRKSPLPNVYKYYSAQAFLRDCFEAKKHANASFSVRAWAKQLGLKSHTALQASLKGERKTSVAFFKPLCKSLNLTAEEAQALLLLINIENSKDQYSRLMLLDKLDTLKKKRSFTMAELADFEFLSDPFQGLMIELTDRADFVEDVAWIKSQSLIAKSSEEIRTILQTLVERGFLKREGDKLKKTNQHITNVHDLANIGSQKYHRNASLLASQMIETQSVADREFNGYALNVRQRDMDKMKASIRAFVKEFILEFEAAAGEGDATYQLNAQLFALTRNS